MPPRKRRSTKPPQRPLLAAYKQYVETLQSIEVFSSADRAHVRDVGSYLAEYPILQEAEYDLLLAVAEHGHKQIASDAANDTRGVLLATPHSTLASYQARNNALVYADCTYALTADLPAAGVAASSAVHPWSSLYEDFLEPIDELAAAVLDHRHEVLGGAIAPVPESQTFLTRSYDELESLQAHEYLSGGTSDLELDKYMGSDDAVLEFAERAGFMDMTGVSHLFRLGNPSGTWHSNPVLLKIGVHLPVLRTKHPREVLKFRKDHMDLFQRFQREVRRLALHVDAAGRDEKRFLDLMRVVDSKAEELDKECRKLQSAFKSLGIVVGVVAVAFYLAVDNPQLRDHLYALFGGAGLATLQPFLDASQTRGRIEDHPLYFLRKLALELG